MVFRIQGRLVDNLPKIYGIYTGGFIVFILLMAILEQTGGERRDDRHSLRRLHDLHLCD